jgi:hypothetical protein
LKKASIEEVCCLGSIRQKSSSSDLKEERKEAQARLNSCRLKWYRAREELLAMLLEFVDKKDASNSDLQSCMKDIVSILRGRVTSDDMIQKIEEAAGARKTSEDESAPSEK